jgi:hypothetical protein
MEPEDFRASERTSVDDRKVPVNREDLSKTRETLEPIGEPLAGSHEPIQTLKAEAASPNV